MRTFAKIIFASIAFVLLLASFVLMLPIAIVAYPVRYFGGKEKYTNTLLFFASVILKLWLYPLVFLYRMTYPGRTQYLFDLAILNDIEGNVAGATFFNDIFIKDKNIEPYGKLETLSDNTGDNFLKQNLSITGQLFGKFLDMIDTNHLIKSAKEDK